MSEKAKFWAISKESEKFSRFNPKFGKFREIWLKLLRGPRNDRQSEKF